jgi:hypothetical protein
MSSPVPPSPAASAAPVSPVPSGSRWGRRIRWLLVALPVAAVALVALYVWAALSFSYSTGDRAGYVQKFSRKGWVCKTWEGELAMVTIPGSAPEIFRFTVRDDAVAAAINRLMGQRVALSYEQHVGVPTSCFGETQYFVVKARPVPGP